MSAGKTRKEQEREVDLVNELRIDAIRARRRSPAARAEEAKIRAEFQKEYRETGTLKTTGDGTTMRDLVSFREFIMYLRQERELLGLSLGDVAERAKITKSALSRLENGQQLNPTINTLSRYARALGKRVIFGMAEPEE